MPYFISKFQGVALWYKIGCEKESQYASQTQFTQGI